VTLVKGAVFPVKAATTLRVTPVLLSTTSIFLTLK